MPFYRILSNYICYHFSSHIKTPNDRWLLCYTSLFWCRLLHLLYNHLYTYILGITLLIVFFILWAHLPFVPICMSYCNNCDNHDNNIKENILELLLNMTFFLLLHFLISLYLSWMSGWRSSHREYQALKVSCKII